MDDKFIELKKVMLLYAASMADGAMPEGIWSKCSINDHQQNRFS